MYNNCPHCGNEYDDGGTTKKNAYKCNYCDFTFYNNPKPAVNGFILGSDGKSFLMTQRKFEPYKECWGVPGGFLDYGEDPKDALRRELKEELCVDVEVMRLLGTYNEVYHNGGSKDETYSVVVLVYLVEVSDMSAIRADDDAIAFEFFPFSDLPHLAFENQRDFLMGVFKQFKS
ncbi:MAG: NUDIX domain-containing protein [Hyphomicrobium sp.]|uniref:NUDIX hydrolase n=1 Tax=Hyphomicrobium sp. TaxID=82 RepID=UPI00356358CA